MGGLDLEAPVWPGDTDGTVKELVLEEDMVLAEVGAADGGNSLGKTFMG